MVFLVRHILYLFLEARRIVFPAAIFEVFAVCRSIPAKPTGIKKEKDSFSALEENQHLVLRKNLVSF